MGRVVRLRMANRSANIRSNVAISLRREQQGDDAEKRNTKKRDTSIKYISRGKKGRGKRTIIIRSISLVKLTDGYNDSRLERVLLRAK